MTSVRQAVCWSRLALDRVFIVLTIRVAARPQYASGACHLFHGGAPTSGYPLDTLYSTDLHGERAPTHTKLRVIAELNARSREPTRYGITLVVPSCNLMVQVQPRTSAVSGTVRSKTTTRPITFCPLDILRPRQ